MRTDLAGEPPASLATFARGAMAAAELARVEVERLLADHYADGRETTCADCIRATELRSFCDGLAEAEHSLRAERDRAIVTEAELRLLDGNR